MTVMWCSGGGCGGGGGDGGVYACGVVMVHLVILVGCGGGPNVADTDVGSGECSTGGYGVDAIMVRWR